MIALFVAITVVVIILILLLIIVNHIIKMVFKDYFRYKESRDEVRYILNQMYNSINASSTNRTFMEDIQDKSSNLLAYCTRNEDHVDLKWLEEYKRLAIHLNMNCVLWLKGSLGEEQNNAILLNVRNVIRHHNFKFV